jgi:hypothetical protein
VTHRENDEEPDNGDEPRSSFRDLLVGAREQHREDLARCALLSVVIAIVALFFSSTLIAIHKMDLARYWPTLSIPVSSAALALGAVVAGVAAFLVAIRGLHWENTINRPVAAAGLILAVIAIIAVGFAFLNV